jgi:hypothetical protein
MIHRYVNLVSGDVKEKHCGSARWTTWISMQMAETDQPSNDGNFINISQASEWHDLYSIGKRVGLFSGVKDDQPF